MPRYKLIQKILWLSHQTGKEITEDILMGGCYDDDGDEKQFLKDIYKGLLVRWRNHQLPLVTDERDI